jgi:hypothetical protein
MVQSKNIAMKYVEVPMSIVTKASPLPPIHVQIPLLAAKQGSFYKTFEDLVPTVAPSLVPIDADSDSGHLVDIVV